tara:strand:+ start:3162 stop:4862 length:1701 start_codon:yes stop_codon:yes gene_type:complete
MGCFHFNLEALPEEAVHASVVLTFFLMVLSVLHWIKVPILHLQSGFFQRTIFSVTVPLFIMIFNVGLNILILLYFRKYFYLFSSIIICIFTSLFLGYIPVIIISSFLFIYCMHLDGLDLKLLIFYGLFLLFIIELFSLINWIIFVPLGLSSIFLNIAIMEEQIYYLFSLFSPLLVLLFLFGWIPKRIINWYKKDNLFNKRIHQTSINHLPLIGSRFFFVSALLLSIFIPIYPYFSTINPAKEVLSPDLMLRARVVDTIRSDWTSIFREMSGSRPAYLMVVFILQSIFHIKSVSFIMYSPILLFMLLVFSMYYFVRQSYGKNDLAVLSSFLLSSGANFLLGIYLYPLSNLLGLCLVFFSLGLLFSSLKREAVWTGYFSIALFFMVLFVHPWTFFQYCIVIIPFLFIKLKENSYSDYYRFLVKFLVSGLVLILPVFFLLSTNSIRPYLNLVTLSLFIDTFRAVNFVYAGALSNIVPWLLSAYYLSGQSDERDVSKFLRLLVFLTSILFLFLNPFDKSRALINLPLGYFAALGLSKLNLKLDSKNGLIFALFLLFQSIVFVFRTLYFFV